MGVSRGRRSGRWTSTGGPTRAVFLVLCVLATLTGGVGIDAAGAEPLRRPLQPADARLFDLVGRVAADPDLLTPRQVVVRAQRARLGLTPTAPQAPSLATVFGARLAERAEWDPTVPPRTRVEWSYDVDRGQAVRLTVPEDLLFRAVVDTNEVGIVFPSQRPVDDPRVGVDYSALDAHVRAGAARALQAQWTQQVLNRTSSGDAGGELLNFTLPIRLPRTLERIIGRGDATSIRISGTEQIRIGGSTTRRSDFIGNEIQQSQSLFPQLELEQNLRVNLDGQVGEKIKVRVSHDSQRLGSESTEIRLSFEGDEDDIVQTIRAGNIDVTLPGSQLLGVGATRGGSLGIFG